MLIVNSVASNGGDAAILRAIIRHVREALGPGTEVDIADDHHARAGALHPDLRFIAPLQKAFLRYPRARLVGRLVRDANLLRWRAAARLHRLHPASTDVLLRPREARKLREYAGYDLVVSTGGTYLVERYSPWPRLTELRVVDNLGIPYLLYTQSLGPFQRPDLVRGVRRVVGDAAAVLLRDGKSLGHLRDIGAREDNCSVVSDAVFTFADPARWAAGPEQPADVVISVRPWAFFARPGAQEAYRAAIAHVTAHLVGRGAHVTFLSTCQGVTGYIDDSAEAAAIAELLPADVARSVTVDRDHHDTADLRARLAACDLVVSTRMHVAILALCDGTPVVPIAYEFKTRELFETLGLGEFVADIDDVDGPGLSASVDAFWAARERWIAALPQAVDGQRRSADVAIEHVSAAAPLDRR